MKNICTALLLLIIFSTSGYCQENNYPFAIYYVKVDNQDINKIKLVAEPVITNKDIIEYNWDTHEITLTDEGIKKIPSNVSVQGRYFIITTGDIKCYKGAFWSSSSSISCPIPIINLHPINPPKDKNTIKIEKAYPTAKFGKEKDPRNNINIYIGLVMCNLIKPDTIIYHDPIEDDPNYIDIFKNINAEVDEALNDYPLRDGFGYCHVFWNMKAKILKEKYGINWKSPQELDPFTFYD
jgi:hypothetical protein